MNKISLTNFNEYRLQGVLDRLENFRNSIGWGQLNDDLDTAIDCIELVMAQVKETENAAAVVIGDTAKAHWIVTDHGFAGSFYKCSVCGNGYWNSDKYLVDHCPYCKVTMDIGKGDESMNEYNSETD